MGLGAPLAHSNPDAGAEGSAPGGAFEMQAIYDKFWKEAADAFARGEVQPDPLLANKEADPRRGVTLLLRPSAPVREKVAAWMWRLEAELPGQYFYRPEELHVTVLAIISGTPHWQAEMGRLDACRAMIAETLRRRRSFGIAFRGVTASAGSVMVQGYPAGDELAAIRDGLREAFAAAGMGGLLDRRYRIGTAHMTAVRFRAPAPEGRRVLALLEARREEDFGEMEADRLQLVWGDWYASAGVVRRLEEYGLEG